MRSFVFSLLMLISICSSVWAGLIAHDPFTGTPGSVLHGTGGGTGFSFTWFGNSGSTASVQSGSLQSPTGTLDTSDHRAQLTANNGDFFDNIRPFNSTFGTDGTTLWLSFLVRKTAQGTSFDYGGVQLGTLFIGDPGTNNDWVLEKSGSGGMQNTGITATLDTTFFLVTRMDFVAGPDTVSLWVNPTPGLAAPAGSPNATKSDLNFSFSDIAFLYGSGGSTASWSFDELRLGTTYLSVAPVPEPSSLLAVGLFGLVLAVRRRR